MAPSGHHLALVLVFGSVFGCVYGTLSARFFRSCGDQNVETTILRPVVKAVGKIHLTKNVNDELNRICD